MEQTMQAEKTEVIRTGITGSTLKIIAMITMLIDHIGATIVLQLVQRNSDNFDAFGNVRMTGMVILYYVLRGIGRLAFPIFIFLLLEGFQYTHNRKDVRIAETDKGNADVYHCLFMENEQPYHRSQHT